MIYYKLKCKDLGFDSCEFTFIGNTENELKRKFFLHTIMNHEKDFELMTEEKKLKFMIQSAIISKVKITN
jgi:predicted small metal-binding protein